MATPQTTKNFQSKPVSGFFFTFSSTKSFKGVSKESRRITFTLKILSILSMQFSLDSTDLSP